MKLYIKGNYDTELEYEDALEAALMSFESGHNFNESDFSSVEEYNEYINYMDMGPVGFYNEFHDELDFSDDFISEYGYEVSQDETFNYEDFMTFTPSKEYFDLFKSEADDYDIDDILGPVWYFPNGSELISRYNLKPDPDNDGWYYDPKYAA